MFEAILLTIVTAATPLLLAAIGELVVEKSGVLNLGVEGMMVMGAVAGFAVTVTTGSPFLGVLGGAVAGQHAWDAGHPLVEGRPPPTGAGEPVRRRPPQLASDDAAHRAER